MKRQRVNPELPPCMRFSSLEERRRFYSGEFDLKRAEQWMRGHGPTIYALILGRYTRKFPREYARIWKNTIIVDDHKVLSDLRQYILQYAPESVYYDRNLYSDLKVCSRCGRRYSDCWECEGFLGQELAFDLDVENIECPLHGDLDERVRKGDSASFCAYDLWEVRDRTIALIDELKSSFKKIKVVYSGRGYHIHVFDKKAYKLSEQERKELAGDLLERYPIDEWVTEGESHLIRLPFSLNALVTRSVLPITEVELSDFDPLTDKRCIPSFVSGRLGYENPP